MKPLYSRDQLETFFKEVAELTLEHDVLEDSSIVYVNNLEKALIKVDKQWYRTIWK